MESETVLCTYGKLPANQHGVVWRAVSSHRYQEVGITNLRNLLVTVFNVWLYSMITQSKFTVKHVMIELFRTRNWNFPMAYLMPPLPTLPFPTKHGTHPSPKYSAADSDIVTIDSLQRIRGYFFAFTFVLRNKSCTYLMFCIWLTGEQWTGALEQGAAAARRSRDVARWRHTYVMCGRCRCTVSPPGGQVFRIEHV